MTKSFKITGFKYVILSSTVLALAACGGESKQESPASKPVTTQTQPEKTTAIQKPAAAKSSISPGRKAFVQCQACHTLKPGDKHLVGPNLSGLFGSISGTKPGFKYSKDMVEKAIVWTPETLDAYITSPRKVVPKGTMAYAGMRSAEKRQALIEYLQKETAVPEE